tara:strand:- start:798 stop:2054 length:1257 start_codon:yes stop_codon:yes gene_type:complete
MRLLDCNDASLRLWNEGDALWSPGVVWLSGDRYLFGEPAWEQARRAPREISNRYWHRLSTQPLSPALGPARHTADLVHAHLESLLDGISGDITLAIPGAMESGQLSLLLGILQTLPVAVSNVVHRSALVGAATGQSCAHVELQLHQASITAVTVDNGVARAGETQLLPGRGLLGLMNEIAERIGEQFVAQTRFDPQRRAETEQALHLQLPDLLRTLGRQSEVSCSVEGHAARIAADALRPVGAAFTQVLAPLLPAGTEHIALDALLSALPGLDLPVQATTTGPDVIPLMAGTLAPSAGELHFQREAPCDSATSPEQAPAESQPLAAASAQADTAQESPESRPTPGSATHSLMDGHAVPLSPGKHIADGVSAMESGVIDIAPGTPAELNDQPVAGRVAVNASDRLCAGGVEVRFITVVP